MYEVNIEMEVKLKLLVPAWRIALFWITKEQWAFVLKKIRHRRTPKASKKSSLKETFAVRNVKIFIQNKQPYMLTQVYEKGELSSDQKRQINVRKKPEFIIGDLE